MIEQPGNMIEQPGNLIDNRIKQLIPHRPPMLLINSIGHIDHTSASSIVRVTQHSPFYDSNINGVPAWIGLEYMGQTAALIAGQQLEQGELEPHLGILLGSRSYKCSQSEFNQGQELLVHCEQTAVVGSSLVKFRCTISDYKSNTELAQGTLSVLRTAEPQ